MSSETFEELLNEKENEITQADFMVKQYQDLIEYWRKIFQQCTEVRFEINDLICNMCGPEQDRDKMDNVVNLLRVITVYEHKLGYLKPTFMFNFNNEKIQILYFEKELHKFKVNFHNNFLMDSQGICVHRRMPCPIESDKTVRQLG